MAVSKVVYGGRTLIDLTGDTVESSKLLVGITAHGKDGEQITGTCDFDSNTMGATAAASEILETKTAFVRGAEVTGSMKNNGGVAGYISAKEEQYSVPQGFHDGSGKVGIADAEKQKLISENIREGITLLGIAGSMTGTEDAIPEAVSVTPSLEEQVILPNAEQGYNYISQVTVAPIPYEETQNSAGGTTVTIG
jgi:hypothetical protein